MRTHAQWRSSLPQYKRRLLKAIVFCSMVVELYLNNGSMKNTCWISFLSMCCALRLRLNEGLLLPRIATYNICPFYLCCKVHIEAYPLFYDMIHQRRLAVFHYMNCIYAMSSRWCRSLMHTHGITIINHNCLQNSLL